MEDLSWEKRERKEEVDSVGGSVEVVVDLVWWRLKSRSSIDKCFFCKAAHDSSLFELVTFSISSSIFLTSLKRRDGVFKSKDTLLGVRILRF
jgi:hypothetical protein